MPKPNKKKQKEVVWYAITTKRGTMQEIYNTVHSVFMPAIYKYEESASQIIKAKSLSWAKVIKVKIIPYK